MRIHQVSRKEILSKKHQLFDFFPDANWTEKKRRVEPEAELPGMLEESRHKRGDLSVEFHGAGEGRGSRQQQQVSTVLRK